MKVIFLGTSGSMPTPTRNSTSIVIKKEREIIMFDCGEGTQRQMTKAKVGFRRNMHILISHLHGDHVLGLPGIIQTMSLLRREKNLNLFGPPGIINYIKAFSNSLGVPTFPVLIHEIREPGIIHENQDYKIIAIQADHKIIAYSYAFIENPRPGKFHPQKAEALEIPKGKLWHKLQHGEKVTINNKTFYPYQVTEPPRKGRKIVYSGDTRPTETLVEIAENADLLIHEATFLEDLLERASNDGHTTAAQAAQIAKRSNVKKLVLTHISSRYPNPSQLLEEAHPIFPETIIAKDFMEINLPK
jgi:ribonuclease Z